MEDGKKEKILVKDEWLIWAVISYLARFFFFKRKNIKENKTRFEKREIIFSVIWVDFVGSIDMILYRIVQSTRAAVPRGYGRLHLHYV